MDFPLGTSPVPRFAGTSPSGRRPGRHPLAAIAATVIVALIATATAALAAPGFDVALPASPEPPASNADWITIVNYYRAMGGVDPLTENDVFSAEADLHAEYMANTGNFTHDENSDSAFYSNGGDFAGRRAAITTGQCNTRDAIEAMMRQPFNSVRIMDQNLVSTGFGIHNAAGRCAAALDVVRGRTGVAAVVTKTWPANGTTVGLTTLLPAPLIDQLPDARTSCPPGHTGLPLIAYLPTDSAGTGPSAILKRDGVAVDTCVFDSFTYENPDTTNYAANIIVPTGSGDLQDIGRELLRGPLAVRRNAVVVLPKDPLSVGSAYEATVSRGTDTVSWAFRAAPPNRILDTRVGNGGPATKFAAGTTRRVKIAGRGGLPGPNIGSVALNLSTVNSTAASFLTIYPAGNARPLAANVNFAAGQALSSLTIVKLNNSGGAGATDGSVDVYNHAGSTDVVIDVAGWFEEDATPEAGEFTAINPTPTIKPRILDTRTGVGAIAGKVAPNATVNLLVAGRASLPAASEISAVALILTATEPTGAGFLSSYPRSGTRPPTSDLNFTTSRTVTNLAIIRVSQEASSLGRINIDNVGNSNTHVVADVVGYFKRDGAPGDGGYVPTSLSGPSATDGPRILDTRTGRGVPTGFSGKLGPASTMSFKVLGVGGIPAVGVDSVVLNVTVTQPTAASFLTAFPTGTARPPLLSNLTFPSGLTVSNAVIVKVGAGGKVDLYNHAGSTHVVIDVQGYFKS